MTSVSQPRRRSARLTNILRRNTVQDNTVVEIAESDSDEGNEQPETMGKTKSTSSRPKRKMPDSSDYEDRRLMTIQENNAKLKALGVPELATTINNLVSSTKIGKEKVVPDEDDDGEYRPDSDSAEDGDDDQEDEPATTPKVPVKKMPRVNKASSRPQAEAQTHPHSPKPKKAPTPTTAVTVQQPEPQSSTEHQLPVNTTTSTSKMTKSKVQSAKLASNILSHIVPASTPNYMNEKTKFHGPRTLHWETLENLNVHTQFSEWLTPVWRRFFDLRRPVYKKLIFEFFSTYRFNKQTLKTAKDTAASSMSFSLRGKTFNLSFKEFGVAMNLYTKEEVEGEDFGSGLIGWPSDVSMGEFWSTFGAGQYQKNLSCTAITKPSYRILHRLISESINQRGSCTNLVTQEDMFYMFCIVNNRPCNLAKCLARYLYKSVGKSEASAVCGGAYISQLAVGLGVYNEEELDAMEQLASTGLFDETQLRRLEIVEKSPPLRFVDPSKASANDAPKKDTTDAALSSRLDAVERELHWVSSGLHYLIHKLGHSFAPPPHVKAHVPASHQHTSAAPDTANAASSSSCPSQSF